VTPPTVSSRAAAVRHESPALAGSGAPAYEMKFLLSEPQARAVEAMLRGRLALDPHADPALGGYRVTSVYFDTPAFDVYRRAADHRGHKFRLRRYGSDPTAYLERKTKRNGQVWKRRSAVPVAELAHLTDGHADEWPGAWFAWHLAAGGLRPVCRVTYERTAFVGAGPDGPIRLTLDRAAHGLASASPPQVEPFAGGLPLLDGEVIAEFKFLSAMPHLFKAVIGELRLTPSGVSKYRRCAEAAGLVGGGADA
jgi:hypothetical protein